VITKGTQHGVFYILSFKLMSWVTWEDEPLYQRQFR